VTVRGMRQAVLRVAPRGERVRVRRHATLIATMLTLAGAPSASAQDGHDHGGTAGTAGTGARIGLLVADHGEPPEYNDDTYYSFRDFVAGLMETGVIPSWLRYVDTGTIAWDAGCPGCEHSRPDARLTDAWLRPHAGPGVFVPASPTTAAHYVVPGGPGLGEPDVFEHAGLRTWGEYRQMGGRSPNYDEKLPRTEALLAHLRTRYGDRLAVRVGAMIDPRIGGARQGIEEAAEALVRRDRVQTIVVAYMGVGFSDIMQTHHLRHHLQRTLASLGVPDMPVRYAKPLGTTDAYVDGIVDRVRRELASIPNGEPVAVHLSGHGLPTGTCGDYDCGADAYHRSSADLFARTAQALRSRITRSGRWGVFHLYGEGADPDNDPDGKIDSPLEALAKRKADGYRHVIDIPHEFDANSRDTLIVLRAGYGRQAPDWNTELESRFERDGLQVKLANVSGGDHHKIRARETVVDDALQGLVDPLPASRDATVLAHDDHFHPGTVTIARGTTVTWRWTGDNAHDLRFAHKRGRPRIPGVRARRAGEVRRRFTRVGTYRYACTLHDGMKGAVRVR